MGAINISEELSCEDLFGELIRRVSPNRVIHTTRRSSEYRYLKLGFTRNQKALVYSIPSRSGKGGSTKRIGQDVIYRAFHCLQNEESLTREWLKQNFAQTLKDGGCNYVVLIKLLNILTK